MEARTRQNRSNRLGFSVMISHPDAGNIDRQIPLVAAAGYDTFFLSCGVTSDFDLIPHWADLARANGIAFEAVHAPTDGVNALWEKAEGDVLFSYLDRAHHLLDLCGEGGVSKLVMHVAYGGVCPVSEVGLARLSALEDYARARGVGLCYENAGVSEHLIAAVQNASLGHGFCHDTGHHLCYTPEVDYLSLCGKRLMYTHLHDNHGASPAVDEHLLPYDGVTDWSRYVASLAALGYTGTLNLELACIYRPDYRAMRYPDFLTLAHTRVSRLADELARKAQAHA